MTSATTADTTDIRQLGPADTGAVMAAAHLFDDDPRREWAQAFLAREGNHLLIAYCGDQAAGFISGIEILHPDKADEMLLYELGVDESFRRRGIGKALVRALRDLAIARNCRAMWVPIEPDNAAALATYRSAGASAPASAAIMEWTLAP